jgi:tRNA-splicing ligase RtcB
MTVKKVIHRKGLVKIWTDDIDDNAFEQLQNMATLPFIHKHIAAMPDVHWGMGATIGSVIPSKGAIVPAAVGVDLGCGMMAVQTSLTASDLPDNLHSLRLAIERAVPHGGPGIKGGWEEAGRKGTPDMVLGIWKHSFLAEFEAILSKYPKLARGATYHQLGTLGGGNHFIEICLDESDKVWIMLHSGSRGVGNRIGMNFINKAKEEMERYHITEHLAHKDLSYLVEHTEVFDDYVFAVEWAQNYARVNREIMMNNVIMVLHDMFRDIVINKQAINCHHNYIARENHFGSNVLVTRKGAIRAREGDLGIIPGSMGAKSFIVKGKGNKESFCSCSHGAGRTMGRKEAEKRFTVADLIEQTKGIECPKDKERLDEIPAAYKDIDKVMENQSDLVDIVHTLHQVVNVKG